MVSKRKQNRKVKREIRRKVIQKKAANQQQSAVPKDQEMMLKIMAMLKGGGGGNGQPMDTSTFLRLKEEATAKSNENARLIREAKLKKQQSESDKKAAEQEYQVKQAKARAEDAARDLAHQQSMMKLKGTAQGLDDNLRDINREIQESQHMIELNNQNASLDAKRLEIEKLQRELERIKKTLDYKTASQETREIIANSLSHVRKLFDQINVVFDNIDKKQATESELSAVDSLVAEIHPKMKELIAQNEILNHETQIIQDDIKTKHDLTATYRQEKKDLIETQNRMKHLTEQRKHADHVPEYDQDGNVKMKYREALREEIEPENNEHVLMIDAESKRILKYLHDLTGKYSIEEWHDILTAHGNSLLPGVKDVLRRIEGKIKYTNPFNNKTYKTYEKLRDFYKSFEGMYKEALAEADREYQEAKKFNEDLKLTQVIETKPVSREMLADLRLRKAEKDRAMDVINKQIEDKQNLAREVQKLQLEISQMEADLSKMPTSVDMKTEIDELTNKRAELNELLRTKALKTEENDYHAQLEKETRDTNRKISQEKAYMGVMKSPDEAQAISKFATAKRDLALTENDLDLAESKETSLHNLMKRTESQNLDLAIKEKELANIKEKQGEFDALRSELVANEAETSAKKRIWDMKERTHKAENEKRVAQAHLNELETERYIQSQQDIANAESQLAIETEKAKQMNDLLVQRKALRKVEADRQAGMEILAATPGEVSNTSIETLVAIQDQVLQSEKEAAAIEKERVPFIKGFIEALNPELLGKFNDYLTSHRFNPYSNPDDVKEDIPFLLSDTGYQVLNDFHSATTTGTEEEQQEEA